MYSHLPPMEEEGGHHHHDHQVYLHRFLPAYETTSPFPCAFFLSPPPHEEGSSESDDHLQHDLTPQQEEVKEHFFSSGPSSNDHCSVLTTPPAPVVEHGRSVVDGTGDYAVPTDGGSGGWMMPIPKMKFMRKKNMVGSDHDKMIAPMGRPRKTVQITLQEQQGCKINGDHQIEYKYCNNTTPPSTTGPARVCSDCNTTKTPLWRSGPRGPKSLCNACGIRQRKARRAMAAAAALAAGGVIPAAVAPAATKVRVEKAERSAGGSDCTVPFKKRFKFTAATAQKPKKLHYFDEAAMGTTKKSAFRRALPRDEREEAAILLMALSCGLIRG